MMNKAKLAYGLNLSKKPGLSKPSPPKKKPIFGDDDDSGDEGQNRGSGAEEVLGFGDSLPNATRPSPGGKTTRSKNGPPSQPPTSKHKGPTTQFGDLSSTFTSRKYAEDAEKLDPSIYDYDASYDSFKAPKKAAQTAAERKPQYMSNLKKMAEVRDRDRRIAEDKKMQREREAEGDEYADKEKFVTEAYKKQQEENRRLEEEEKRREEEAAKKNKSGGMTGFYKQLLDRDDQRRAEIAKAAEDIQKNGPLPEEQAQAEKAKTDADFARQINEKGGSIAINEEGQVVDKRQLLQGGLNVGAKKKAEVQSEASRKASAPAERDQNKGYFAGGRQSMRDRQSRTMEAQYEQILKRSRDEEEQERQQIEMASKSRKTGTEISSAKERYLARKKAEAEAKKNGLAEQP